MFWIVTWSISHRFRDKRRFPSKIANFSHWNLVSAYTAPQSFNAAQVLRCRLPNLVALDQIIWALIRGPKKISGCWAPFECWGAPSNGAPQHLEICPSHVLPYQIWSLYVKRYLWRSAQICGPSHPVCHGHSRSLEQTWIAQLPMTSY